MAYVRLSGPQQLELREAFFTAFGEMFWDLVRKLNRDPARFTVANNNLEQNILAVLIAAEQDLWLLELVGQAANDRPLDPRFTKLLTEFARTSLLPPGFDPFEMCCLTGDYVMVNRARLRTLLKAMSAANAKRILVVRDLEAPQAHSLAGTKTGKSLTVQFISALKQQLQNFEFIWIDLRAFKDQLGPKNDIMPRDLAGKLVRLLGYGASTVPNAPSDLQWSRWSVEFCDDFELRARQDDQRQVWLVIDEFNKVVLAQETMDLIKQLADRIRVTLPHFRLLLLGFGETLSPQVHPHVEEEAVERKVSDEEVLDFFVRAVHQRQLKATEAMILDAAVKILSGLDPSRQGYLEEVGRRIRDELRRMGGA